MVVGNVVAYPRDARPLLVNGLRRTVLSIWLGHRDP